MDKIIHVLVQQKKQIKSVARKTLHVKLFFTVANTFTLKQVVEIKSSHNLWAIVRSPDS